MNMIAPICPTSRSQVVSGMPGVQLPIAPPATDLPSLIAAVNALRQMLLTAMAPLNPVAPLLTQNTPFQQGGGVGVMPNWDETRRDTQQVRVYNKQDKTIFVDVERINSITFQYAVVDPTESFVWRYYKKQPGAGAE